MTGEVVGEALRLLRDRLWETLLTLFLLLAPLELVVAVLDPDFSSLARGWWPYIAANVVVTLIAYPWTMAAVVYVAGNDSVSPVTAYAATARKLPTLVASTTASCAAIAVGLIALVVPGLVLIARWAVVIPVIVVEGAGWREALGRSNHLVSGRTRSVLALAVVLLLVAVVVSAGFWAIAYWRGDVFAAWIAALVFDVVVGGVFSVATLVLYRRLAT